MIPKPPRNLPFPEPSWMFSAYCSTTIGYRTSMTSLDIMYVSPSPEQTSPLSPSFPRAPPHPPGCGSTMAKGCFVLSSIPPTIVAQTLRKCPADNLSGIIGARACHTRSVMKAIDSQYVEVGAGGIGLKIVPGSAITLSALKFPSLTGPWVSVTALKIALAAETVAHQGQLIEPLACFPDPLRSTTNSSTDMVIFALTWTGVSVIPSSSTVSS